MNPLLALCALSARNSMSRGGELLLMFIGCFITLFISASVWNAAPRIGQIAEIGKDQLIMYSVCSTAFVMLSPYGVISAIERDLADGGLCAKLILPKSYLSICIAQELGVVIARSTVILPAAGLVIWCKSESLVLLNVSFISMSVVFLGYLLSISIYMLVAIIGAKYGTSFAAEWVLNSLSFALSGTLVPLDFYPALLRSISLYMPFFYMNYKPISMLALSTGSADPECIFALLGWLLGTSLSIVIVWRLVLRGMTYNGG